MLNNYILLTLIVLIQQNVLFAGQIPRPRGVSISKAVLYQSKNNNFTCLDGLKVIEYNKINDNYCDCNDASDEPGTSACPNGYFYCTNAGHRPLTIPSSRVSDGICDCCDGSDEFKTTKENLCENTCMELGRVERYQRKIEEELIKKGASLRTELCTAGKQIKAERTSRLIELEDRLKGEMSIKAEKEVIKNESELLESEALEVYKEVIKDEEPLPVEESKNENPNHNEAAETFRKYDTNANDFLEIAEIQAHLTFDRNRDGIVSIEEAKFFLEEQDQIDLEEFISLSWPRVKPYLMLAQGVFEAPKNEENIETENKINEVNSEHEAEDVDPEEEVEAEENYESEEDDMMGEGSVVEETPTTTPKPQIEYDPETQRLIDLANNARNSYNEAERVVREIENEIKEIQNQNAKDYGTQEEFATLDGECFTFEDREYIYKLCPFDRASQQQKAGGAETTLGRWENWLSENDNSNNKYSHQKYSHGASCWNGPQRSTIVRMKCGLENKITGVAEPNRCEYSFIFETPAACVEVAVQGNDTHDEL